MTSDRIPFLVRVGILLCVIGVSFPIYGITLLTFKLTLFRAGSFVLMVLAFFYGLKIKKRGAENVLFLLGVFAVIRLMSLAWTDNVEGGLKQIVWFIEGGTYLLSLIAISTSFNVIPRMYFRAVAFVGLVSIGVMALQLLMIPFGKLLELPLSTSAYGISQEQLNEIGIYPLYNGGRIIGGFWEPNMSGSMCAYYVATFLPFIALKQKSIGVNRWFIVMALCVSLIACIGTGSRQSILAIMLTCSVTCCVYSWLKPRLVIKIIIPGLIMVLLGTYFFLIYGKSETTIPSGLVQENVFVRLQRGSDEGDFTGNRYEAVRDVLNKMDVVAITMGHGEGSSGGSSHNGYLSVLYENGGVALVILIILSLNIVVKPIRYINKKFPINTVSWAVASVCVALTWILLVFINWAQLNDSISFMYLAVIFLFLNSGVHVVKTNYRIDLLKNK